MTRLGAIALTLGLPVLLDSGDLLESAVIVAIVYGIFGLLEILLRAWIKRRKKAKPE